MAAVERYFSGIVLHAVQYFLNDLQWADAGKDY